jgi:hypothetical protein
VKHIARLLLATAVLLSVASGQVAANSATAAGDDATPALEIVASVGPWPVLSALIGYRGRLWFANSVRYPDHNSADIYSLGLADGDLRFERHLFSQDVGIPVVDGGLLYWPYEDPRASVGWGHIAVTDGITWQLRVMQGDLPMYHVHAMASLDGQLYAATSAWRAGLHRSLDGGLRWRQFYDHPTPDRQLSRIHELAGFGGRLFGTVVEHRDGTPRYPMLAFEGDAVTEVPGWPETARSYDLAATSDGVHGLVRGDGGTELWRTDGMVSERLSEPATMPLLTAFAAGPDGFWGVSDSSSDGVGLWHSGDGGQWRRVQDLAGGRPVDIVTYHGRVYVSGTGADGRGILWGPPPTSSLIPPADPPPAWPSHPTSEAIDWEDAGTALNEAVSDPDSYRTRLRDLVYGWSLADPPPGFFEAALALPVPDRTLAMFGGSLPARADNLGRHIFLWGMGVAGHGKVPLALLERPWTQPSNRPQKWFDSLPMALFAVSWVGQNNRATVASLIGRLDRDEDPVWLRGDIVGALGAVTGKRFGHDIAAWRRWWAAAEPDWPG